VLETRLNTPDKRAAILASLRGGALVSDIAGLDSTSLDEDQDTPEYRVKTLNECWFGMKKDNAGKWVTQPNVFPTGFWNGFQGDPHAIFRAGLIRAIEVSLGIDHGAQWPGAGTSGSDGIGKRIVKWLGTFMGTARDWPIEITWVCQGPFFQAWVTWTKGSGGSGHVSLVLTTPASKGLPVDAKISRPPPVKREYACPPPLNAFAAPRGAWVLGHEDYAVQPASPELPASTLGSEVTVIPKPTLEYRCKSTDVICVAPAEWEGGVLAAGRPYTP
jgi:hypothetical protein